MKRYALQSLCSSRSLISVFCALYAWTAGGALAASAPEDEAVLEARAAQAEKVLADRSFYERWKEPSAIDSVKTAAQVKSDAEGVLKQIEEALAVQRSWCGKKFFVNSCIDDARRASFDREREVREIIVAADEIIRLDRVEKMRAEQEKNALEPRREPMKIAPKTVKTDPPEPMHITPKSVKAPSQPIDIAPKTVKEPSAPMEWEKKTVKDAAAPTPIPGSEMPHDAASERAAAEAANEAYYAQKQLEAQKRMEEAAELAAKRKADREAKQQQFERSLDEREAAQKRYEANQKERKSNLMQYF